MKARLLRQAMLLLTAFAMTGFAGAQVRFPARPVTVIVPFAAGGTADIVARTLGEKVGTELGQSVIVDNRSGANGLIGAHTGARAKPDGYTITQLSTAHVILPSLEQDIPYDWRTDLAPVFGTSEVPQALAVSGKSNVRSIADLVTAAKAGTSLNYGSGGSGSISHLTAARLVQALKLNAAHIPYRGLGAAVQAVLGDQVHFTVVNTPDVVEFAKSGALRVLAVTSAQRLPILPSVPTMAELGFPDVVASSWTCYMVPASTPTDVVERLHAAFAKAASDAGVQERLGKLGVTTLVRSPAELTKFMREEAQRWRRVIDDNRIKLDK